MDGDEQDPELLIRQHHGKIGGPRLRGQDLGMSGVVDARRLHRLLVQRRGDDGIDLAGLGEADCALDIGISGRARPRIDAPERQIGGQPTRRQEIHLPGAGFGLGGCRDDAQRQPGADDTDGAIEDRLIADDEGRRQAALGPELGDNLGTDARRIAHGEPR